MGEVACSTVIFSVAVPDKLPGSVTLTTNELVPMSAGRGVPETEPAESTLNQAGPLTFAKLRISVGLGSLALVAMVPEMLCPAVTPGNENGSMVKDGAPL